MFACGVATGSCGERALVRENEIKRTLSTSRGVDAVGGVEEEHLVLEGVRMEVWGPSGGARTLQGDSKLVDTGMRKLNFNHEILHARAIAGGEHIVVTTNLLVWIG
jgi:hypothetical protein